MKGYIYKIINKKNGKFYVGSTINIDKRKKRHFSDLEKNKHHCLFLQRAYKKYGKESFSFSFKVIDINNEKELRLLEERYIRFCWNSGKLYNISKNGSGGDLISYHPNNKKIRELQRKLVTERYTKMSDDDRKKLSRRMKGDSNPNYGNYWTDEMKENVSKFWKKYYSEHESYQKGKTYEELFGEEKAKELKIKISKRFKERVGDKNSFYGKHHSIEAKEKMRKFRLGKKPVNSKKVFYNNTIYESANECAKKLGIPMTTVAYRCRKEIYGFKYVG